MVMSRSVSRFCQFFESRQRAWPASTSLNKISGNPHQPSPIIGCPVPATFFVLFGDSRNGRDLWKVTGEEKFRVPVIPNVLDTDDHGPIYKPAFNVDSHHKGKYGTGGHNWYMTTRFDVYFYDHPDGWIWYGALITGGDNTSFKMRRIKDSRHFDHVAVFDHVVPPLRKPDIERIPDIDALAILDRDDPEQYQLRYYAKKFSTGWVYATTIGDLFAQRLIGEQRHRDAV